MNLQGQTKHFQLERTVLVNIDTGTFKTMTCVLELDVIGYHSSFKLML